MSVAVINFFENACKTSSNLQEFVLCDKLHPIKEPAYIDVNKQNIENWIAEVENKTQILIDFYAIDNCVEILRPDRDRETESSCDGMIYYKDVSNLENIIFIELKNRMSGGWLGKGVKQLKITLEKFIENNNIGQFNMEVAYVCNQQNKEYPMAKNSNIATVKQFKDETASLLGGNGLILKVDWKIIIK